MTLPPPLSQRRSVPILTADPASANVTIDFSSSGPQLPATLWGVSGFDNPTDPFGELVKFPQTMLAQLSHQKFGSLRIPATAMLSHAFAQGNTAVMDDFFSTIQPRVLLEGGRLVIGIGWAPDATPDIAAAEAVAFLNAMHDQDRVIADIEVGNEPIGAVSDYLGFFNAITDAVHQQVDPTIKVFGPIGSSWNSVDIAQFVAGVGTRSPVGFGWHSAPFTADDTADMDKVYAAAAGFAEPASVRQALAGTPMQNVELAIGQHCMNDADQGLVQDGGYQGAIVTALTIAAAAQSDAKLMMQGWSLCAPGTYFSLTGNLVFGDDQTKLPPRAFYLSQASQIMPGAKLTATTTESKLQVLGTRNGSSWSLQLVNFDTAATPLTAKIAVTGGSVQALMVNRWDIGSGNQFAPGISTTSNLAGLLLPAQGVTILQGHVA